MHHLEPRHAKHVVEPLPDVVVRVHEIVARRVRVTGVDADAQCERERFAGTASMSAARSSNVAPIAVPLPAVVSMHRIVLPGRARQRFGDRVGVAPNAARALVDVVAGMRDEIRQPERLASLQLGDERLDRPASQRRRRGWRG